MLRFICMLCGIALAGLLLGTLTACTPPPKTETETEVSDRAAPENRASASTDPAPSQDARAAYAALLRQVLATQTLPNGTALDHADTKTLDWNEFALYDLDGDEQPELILRWVNASVAGSLEVVYGFDAASGTPVERLREFPGITYYEGGAARAPWSHNQGLAGDFWPYNLHKFDPAKGVYDCLGAVDAWDKALHPTDFDGTPFPDAIDADGDGFVYYLLSPDARDYTAPVDGPAWDDWQRDLVGDGEPLSIPFMSLTEGYISAALEQDAPFGIPLDFDQSDPPAPFARVIEEYCRTGTLPDGRPSGEIPSAIAYAVLDVDEDGQDELILQNENTATAAMAERIYAFDPSAQVFQEEFCAYPDLIYFTGGVILANWSHNQGRSGETLWPYTLYQYDPASGRYEEAGSVDGWDRSLSEHLDALGSDFPASLDLDADGFLYLLLPPNWAGEYTRATLADTAEYQLWRDSLVSGSPFDLPYRSLDVPTFYPAPCG